MDINLVKIVINGVNLVKIGHFRWKYPKFHHLWGVKMKSYVKILGKWSKNFFTKTFEKLFQGGIYGWICLKKSLKGSKCPKGAFFVIFYYLIENFTKSQNPCTTHVPLTFFQNLFSLPFLWDVLYITKVVASCFPPPRFFRK